MRRRDFLGVLGATSASWPFTARAQQQAMPVVGLLRSTALSDAIYMVNSFRKGLSEEGFNEGRNVALEIRYAENHPGRLRGLAEELIASHAEVIAANSIAALAVKAATATIPIVFTSGSDPVRDGLVPSLSRPGGNVTGVVFITGDLGAKRLALLRQFVPKATIIGLIVYPNTAETEAERSEVETAAKATGQRLIILDVHSDSEMDAAFATFIQRGVGAVLTGSGPFMFSKRERLVELAARYAVPTMHTNREAAVAGGLMSYGTSITEAYRQAGIYSGRILKGEKPGNLPVLQSSKFELIINLKTAKALSLEFHPQLLATADEVIE